MTDWGIIYALLILSPSILYQQTALSVRCLSHGEGCDMLWLRFGGCGPWRSVQALGRRLVFVLSSFVGRLLFLVLVVDGLDLLACQLHLVLELLHLTVHLVDE